MGGTLYVEASGTCFEWYASGNELVRATQGGTAVIASGVTGLNFSSNPS